MNPQPAYRLRNLRVVYTSKLRDDLTNSVRNLRKTIESAYKVDGESLTLPAPKRLQRRAWRVWYNKAPHAIGWSKRHYVFHDWRYAFAFDDVNDVRRTMNSVLGSMAKDTSCVVDFAWHNPGSAEYNSLLERSEAERLEGSAAIEVGYQANLAKANARRQLHAGDQSIQKHKYMNYRQYVGANS